jgi:hypothetical protein
MDIHTFRVINSRLIFYFYTSGVKRYDVLQVLTVSVKSEHDVVEVHKLQAFVFGLEALLSSLKTITFPLLYRVSQRSLDTTGTALKHLVARDYNHTLYKCNVIIILSELRYTSS